MDPFERGLVWRFYHTTIFLLMGKKLNRKSSKSQLWNLSVGKKYIYQCAYICFPITSRISLVTQPLSLFCIHFFLLCRIYTNQTRSKCIVLYIEHHKHMLLYYQHHYLKSVLYLQIACINIYYLQYFHLEF